MLVDFRRYNGRRHYPRYAYSRNSCFNFADRNFQFFDFYFCRGEIFYDSFSLVILLFSENRKENQPERRVDSAVYIYFFFNL